MAKRSGNGSDGGSTEYVSEMNASGRGTSEPVPRSVPLFDFLEGQFQVTSRVSESKERGGKERDKEEEPKWTGNTPDRIVLAAARGRDGGRLGPAVHEISFGPKALPTRERLVEMTNTLLAQAQTDCDALGRKQLYAVAAYDIARSDRAVARLLLSIAPSGMRSALQDEREDDEEEENAKVKLLSSLLNDERRDKRYMLEQTLSVISGAMERDEARIERLESALDGAFKRQIEHMAATEAMLNQAADRKARADWAAWKQAKIDFAVEKGLAMAELFLPKLLAPGAPAASATANPVHVFLSSVTQEQGRVAFGQDTATGVTGGVFSAHQFDLFVKLANASTPDLAIVGELSASLTPDQLTAAQQIFTLDQLMPLVSWLQRTQVQAQPTVQ
jgi:hypothetical protein